MCRNPQCDPQTLNSTDQAGETTRAAPHAVQHCFIMHYNQSIKSEGMGDGLRGAPGDVELGARKAERAAQVAPGRLQSQREQLQRTQSQPAKMPCSRPQPAQRS